MDARPRPLGPLPLPTSVQPERPQSDTRRARQTSGFHAGHLPPTPPFGNTQKLAQLEEAAPRREDAAQPTRGGSASVDSRGR